MVLLLLLLLPLLLLPCALAAPAPDADGLVHIPLVRRTVPDRVANLPHIMDAIRTKYGFKPVSQPERRSSSSSALTDELNDSSYSAVVSIGTPAQQFNLILDTGSSDLWVATDQCLSCTSGIPLFNTAKSSSFKNGTSTVQITYGSGEVAGYVSQDSVSFNGFSMTQELLAVAATSSSLLTEGLSGIMGLGFDTISSLPATPFWQSLYKQNMLSSPVFSFYLERYVNQPQQINAAPGGIFTLGGTNSSLYTGKIEFINMPSGTTPSYWMQEVSSLTIQGKSISVSSSNGLAAIDTGTTLIGAPSSLVQQIWANVPGSVALNGQYAGMYSFPCSSSISVSISFGGTNWPISAADMNIGSLGGSGSTEMCAGAIFDVGSTVGNGGQGVPSWIVGDTFLKNVYTVFQANPPAVGFAQLANGLSSNSTSSGTIPFSVSGTAGIPFPSSNPFGTSGASHSVLLSTSVCIVVALLCGILVAVGA